MSSLFFNKACNFIEKETPTQVFSCEFYKVFKNAFFYMIPLVATSEKIRVFLALLLSLTVSDCGNPLTMFYR